MAEPTDHSVSVRSPSGAIRKIHRNALERFIAAGFVEVGTGDGLNNSDYYGESSPDDAAEEGSS